VSGRRDIDRLRGEIDDLFSELWQVPRFAATAGGFRPQVDSFSTDDPPELTVIVELPGVDPAEVQIVATGRVLVVAGERRRPRGDGRVYQQMEIDYGPFRREVALPEAVDTAAARASYERGLLTIVLPLAQRPREGVRVPIEVRTQR
jgi:HSP20 family protein